MATRYVATQSAIATGTSLKTLVEIATTSTDRAVVYEWWIEFAGTSSTAAPILVELLRATAAITGTTLTPVKLTDFAPTATLTAKHTSSGEGTPGDVLEKHYVHPQGGLIKQYPLGREIEVPVSSFLRIRVTAGADVNAAVGMAWEE